MSVWIETRTVWEIIWVNWNKDCVRNVWANWNKDCVRNCLGELKQGLCEKCLGELKQGLNEKCLGELKQGLCEELCLFNQGANHLVRPVRTACPRTQHFFSLRVRQYKILWARQYKNLVSAVLLTWWKIVSEMSFSCGLVSTKYDVSMEADSVKEFLPNALESSRYHVSLDAHRVHNFLCYAPESTKLELGGGTV